MFKWLLQIFERKAPRTDWQLLKHLGAAAFVEWGRSGHGALDRAWRSCPRAEWLLDVASVLDLDPEVIELSMRACVKQVSKTGGLRAEAKQLADGWRDDASSREQTLADFSRLLERAVEQSPQLKKARQREKTLADSHRTFGGGVDSARENQVMSSRSGADDVELSLMRGYATLVREQISLAEVEHRIATLLASPRS